MSKPTEEGRRRYPHTAGFHADISSDLLMPDITSPCTCTPTCPARCAGQCGCEACSLAFSIFTDESGLAGPYPVSAEQEAEAIALYEAL
jgi:hypothetical protein